jgi:hypothetical protein
VPHGATRGTRRVERTGANGSEHPPRLDKLGVTGSSPVPPTHRPAAPEGSIEEDQPLATIESDAVPADTPLQLRLRVRPCCPCGSGEPSRRADRGLGFTGLDPPSSSLAEPTSRSSRCLRSSLVGTRARFDRRRRPGRGINSVAPCGEAPSRPDARATPNIGTPGRGRHDLDGGDRASAREPVRKRRRGGRSTRLSSAG